MEGKVSRWGSAMGCSTPHSIPNPAVLPAESLKDLVASCSGGTKAETPMEVAKAEVMEMLTPPPSDVGSPSHSSPLSLSGGSSNSSSDSEPDSPLCDHGKVWGGCGGVLSGAGGLLLYAWAPRTKRTKWGKEPRAMVLLPEAAPHPVWGWREGCGGILGCSGVLHPCPMSVRCARCPISVLCSPCPCCIPHAPYPMPCILCLCPIFHAL